MKNLDELLPWDSFDNGLHHNYLNMITKASGFGKVDILSILIDKFKKMMKNGEMV